MIYKHELNKKDIAEIKRDKTVCIYGAGIVAKAFAARLIEILGIHLGFFCDRDKEKWKDYRLAIRALVIDQYYGKNDLGYDIYVKTQSFHCEENTAKKRLNSFIRLIESWDKQGFDNTSRPKVSKDYEVLDGAHRITLARYHQMKTISCDVYEIENGKSFRNDEVDITDGILRKSTLSPEEIDMIISTQCKYSIPDEGRK